MKFFTALIGTCKGTNVFIKLLSQSLGRTFWHLFLLALICSFFVALFTYPSRSEEVGETFKKLKETFGKIQTGKKGMLSEKINETRSFPTADNQFRITYIPDTKKGKLPEIDANDVSSGFLWTPTMLASWLKFGDKFILIPFAYYSDRMLSIENLERSSILSYINNNTSLKNEFVSPYSDLSWPSLENYCNKTLASTAFVGNMLSVIFQILFFVMMFSFILNLSARGSGAPVLKYKNRYIIGIYASFPPMLIATLFSAFELPYINPSSVYVICFSVYLIVVYTNLQLNLNAVNQGKNEQEKS